MTPLHACKITVSWIVYVQINREWFSTYSTSIQYSKIFSINCTDLHIISRRLHTGKIHHCTGRLFKEILFFGSLRMYPWCVLIIKIIYR